MKKQLILMGAAAIFTFAACNDSGTSNTTSTDTIKTTNPGDTTIQTTTTTTTTTKTVHPIANFAHRIFYNVKTHKPVKLRMDTVLHYYVDVTTNKEPDYYYYDPAAKDTFDYWGRILNNALIMNNGDYMVDETRVSSETTPTVQSSDTGTMNSTDKMNNGKMKMKQKDDKTKIKTKDK